MFSSFRNQAEVVRVLLENDADPNVKSPNGDTAMRVAAFGGHTDIIRLLKDAGAQE
jgi:ankyrin repeat protein